METKNLLRTNAVVFGLVAILHLLRTILQWDLVVGSVNIAYTVSVIVVLIAGFLSYQNFTH